MRCVNARPLRSVITPSKQLRRRASQKRCRSWNRTRPVREHADVVHVHAGVLVRYGAYCEAISDCHVTANPRRFDGIQVVTLQGSRGLPLLEKKT